MRTAAIILTGLSLLGTALTAQSPSAPPAATPQAAFTYQANVGEVLVQANVLDKHGRAVNNLPASDFTVYENGAPQNVDTFSHDDAPVSLGILVDNSGSMRPKVVQVNQAALNFVRSSNRADEVFIVKFNDMYDLATGFTNSIPKMEHALGDINPESGTALYDALINGINYMHKYAKRPKKVLLLITDGLDDASGHTLQQTLRLMQSVDSPLVYCIGLMDRSEGGAAEKESRKILTRFATETGGVAYFPKNLDQVNQITMQVAHDIRNQYSLVYRSNQTGTGYRTIKVVVRDPNQKNLTAHTRRGYVASDN